MELGGRIRERVEISEGNELLRWTGSEFPFLPRKMSKMERIKKKKKKLKVLDLWFKADDCTCKAESITILKVKRFLWKDLKVKSAQEGSQTEIEILFSYER